MTNKVELSGRVYNPETRTTTSGKQVTRFGLSVWAGKDKEGKNIYHFVNCKYWGNEITAGMNIEIVGKISFDTWEKDGKQNIRQYVFVDSFKDLAQPQQQTNEEQIGW